MLVMDAYRAGKPPRPRPTSGARSTNNNSQGNDTARASKDDDKLPRKFSFKNIFGRDDRTRNSVGTSITTRSPPIIEEKPTASLETNRPSADTENWIEDNTSTAEGTVDEMNEQPRTHQNPRNSMATTLGTSTTVDGNDGDVSDRGSIRVNFSVTDVIAMASEIHAGTIADVNLSLLIYWIKAEKANYNLAREYIRELRMDQGYNYHRLDNEPLRKLLKETKQSRPKYARPDLFEPLFRQTPSVDDLGQPGHLWAGGDSEDSYSTDTSEINLIRYTGDNMWTNTNHDPSREAGRVLAEQHAQMTKESRDAFAKMPDIGSLKAGEINKLRSVKNTARIDCLPPAFLAERERKRKLAARKSQGAPTAVPDYDYPPNTPDRPKPLSLRSPSSTASGLTPTAQTFSRSVSGGQRSISKRNLTPLHLPRTSVILEDTTAHPLLSGTPKASATQDDETNTDDIFGIRGGPQDHGHTPSTARRVGHGTEFHEEDCPGPYQLASRDISSSLSYDSDDEADPSDDEEEDAFIFDNNNTDNEDTPRPRPHTHSTSDDSFSALESYVGTSASSSSSSSSSSSGASSTRKGETTSTRRSHDEYPPHMVYKYGPASSPAPAYRFPSPPITRPSRRANANANANANVNAGTLHRPLPLCSSESEAQDVSRGESVEEGTSSIHSESGILTDVPERSSSLYPPPSPTPPAEEREISPFEQAWRQVNAGLLGTIYGSVDVALEPGDVVFVDSVARQIREDAAFLFGG